ncbi:MAG: hypothetical protein IJZ49_00350 [Alistipes sp.]|nr:hypothetical protein [Alistipes sp.]
MMGPRAVGKTSLMASIFSETRDSVAGAGIYFRPTPTTSAVLTKKKLQLQSIISSRTSIQDSPQTGAIEATSEESTFSFEMGKVGRAHTVNINIKDFPGEYLTSQPERVEEFVAESNVIMVAIDTPYLMEEDGVYNEMKNEVSLVTNFLMRNKNGIKDKMILLVPLKSERYFHDNRLEELNRRVKSAYAGLISLCREFNIACAITPIQTLGHVEFDKFVDNDMALGGIAKISKYRFYGKDPKFAPMFCVQPLYYLLTYVANQYEWMTNQPADIFECIINTFVSYLKDDDEFFHEIKKMGKNIIQDRSGYELVVTNTIFNIK